MNVLSRYGIHMVRRTRGTAMGRTESPLKVELVFGDEEKMRRGKTPRLIREGFTRPGKHIDQIVNGVRYVDDLLLMSKCL